MVLNYLSLIQRLNAYETVSPYFSVPWLASVNYSRTDGVYWTKVLLYGSVPLSRLYILTTPSKETWRLYDLAFHLGRLEAKPIASIYLSFGKVRSQTNSINISSVNTQ